MNKDSPKFDYFVKNCTFEQLSILRQTSESLTEIGVFYLPFAALSEGILLLKNPFSFEHGG